MTSREAKPIESNANRVIFLMPETASWWIWLITACLLAVGLTGFPIGFFAAILLTVLQSVVYWIRERSLSAFPVQLRISYTLLLLVCLLPMMGGLFWLPMIGTFALNIFGYCLLARCLSLLPWNRSESITLELLSRTFFSRPMLSNPAETPGASGCAGGLCTISAQVRPRNLDSIGN